jgi:coenzyme F420-dependent glucose-6-phosphate dehydrogenase
MTIAYHASHEQFSPSELLRYAVSAEEAGFDAIHCSDHFHPWSIRQGNSGYSFSWIAAAMQATNIPFSMVCAPGQRYHPAIVAQAIATIAEMFPGRYSIEFGSGEALNECITGDKWPSKQLRNERLIESVKIIRDLLQGNEVTFKGHIKIKEARLYSLPKVMPLLFLTTGGKLDEVLEKKLAFEKNGGNNKPFYVQHCFSYSTNKEIAIAAAYDQWRTNLLPVDALAALYKPEHFDAKASDVTREEVEAKIDIITSPSNLNSLIEGYLQSGISRLILHNVNRNQEEFINAFSERHK